MMLFFKMLKSGYQKMKPKAPTKETARSRQKRPLQRQVENRRPEADGTEYEQATR